MSSSQTTINVFLCGDVMTGRGVDQILPSPCDPRLYEEGVHSALDYVRLAENLYGEIHRPVDLAYIWGPALAELARQSPDARIVNLETSITHSEAYVPKGINYKMSPENAGCLLAPGIDCCALANNHVLDWGRTGLLETLSTLKQLKIKAAGAGRDFGSAWAPAIIDVAGKGRVVVFSCASVTSGAPLGWAASRESPGIALLPGLTESSVALVAAEIARERRPKDIVILSVHWGPNWGYAVPEEQRRFAHQLIEEANISILHGHSSHHAKGIEVYRNRLILYGCGDFLNDYEGIVGYEEFRDDLPLMYFAKVDPTNGDLLSLAMTPLQIRRFRLNTPKRADVEWLRRTLDRESKIFGAGVEIERDRKLALAWPESRAGAVGAVVPGPFN
jgi:poly-gamma-glutamate capsule biosynthesis protein CapA/YwtB (metallophosphatase superfamily)